jgi:hypothetical protein
MITLEWIKVIQENGGSLRTVGAAPIVRHLEAAVIEGLVKVHRASIGEPEEHALWTLTDKGALALKGGA